MAFVNSMGLEEVDGVAKDGEQYLRAMRLGAEMVLEIVQEKLELLQAAARVAELAVEEAGSAGVWRGNAADAAKYADALKVWGDAADAADAADAGYAGVRQLVRVLGESGDMGAPEHAWYMCGVDIWQGGGAVRDVDGMQGACVAGVVAGLHAARGAVSMADVGAWCAWSGGRAKVRDYGGGLVAGGK